MEKVKIFSMSGLYNSDYLKVVTARLTLHCDVDPFIIAQHLYRDSSISGEIKTFKEFYLAIVELCKQDNSCYPIEYEDDDTYILTMFDERISHNHHTIDIDIWNDSLYPLKVYSINGKFRFDYSNLTNEIFAQVDVVSEIIKDISKTSADPHPYSIENMRHREALTSKIRKYPHFKYLDKYEVLCHNITRMGQLYDIQNIVRNYNVTHP